MFILIVFAFLAGIVTVLSPCILPVLPIVLSSSLASGKKRPLGVVAGFIASFTFFTLFLSLIVQKTGVSAESFRIFAIVMIALMGLGLIVPQFQALLEKLFTRFSALAPKQQKDGFVGGLGVGVSLGLLWTPCVGPILASVISLALTGTVSGSAVFITLAYALGTALPMLAITYGGRHLLQRVPWLLTNTAKIQKGFGVVMIALAVAIAFNVDRKFQTIILTAFPQYGAGLTQIEENSAVKSALQNLKSPQQQSTTKMGKPSFELLNEITAPKAADFVGGTNWVNSPPLSLSKELKGKVVLVDFWTYTCINCIRTLPYVTKWHEKYKDKGFTVIGVHSPEFEIEKNTDNVRDALKEHGISYPVVQDNNFAIWKAYDNHYWPAHYLIDKNGRIRYTHFGEGNYSETENAIRALLDEEPVADQADPKVQTAFQTPETYLGYARAQSYVPTNGIELDKLKKYDFTGQIPMHGVALRGEWNVGSESITAGSNSMLWLSFTGKQVYLVMAPPTGTTALVGVKLDGEKVSKMYWTSDTTVDGKIKVDRAKKYDIVNLDETMSGGILVLDIPKGTQVYAFTFGSEKKSESDATKPGKNCTLSDSGKSICGP